MPPVAKWLTEHIVLLLLQGLCLVNIVHARTPFTCTCSTQVKSLGYEPVVVLSQADRECAKILVKSLGKHAALDELRNKVRTCTLTSAGL